MLPDELFEEALRLCEESDELLRAGKPDEALRRLNFASDSLRSGDEPHGEANVLEAFARVYRATGHMDKAESSIRAALACWMKVEDRTEESRVLGLLASLRISQGDLEDGEFWLKSSLKVLRENGDRAGEADILRSLGALYLRKGELPLAEDHARQAIALFHELDDKVGEARTQGTYAQMLLRRAAFKEAHVAAERCQNLFEDVGHKQGVTSGMQVRSAIMRREGRLEDAEALLAELVKQKREMKDIAGEAGAMNTLGLVVFDIGGTRLNEAERHFLRAIELFNSVNDSQNAALSQQNLADLYMKRGRMNDAELVLRDALKIHERTGGVESQARSLSAIGSTLAGQGRLREALECLKESTELARQVNDTGLVIRMLCPWAELDLLMGKIGEPWTSLKTELAQSEPDADVTLRLVLPLSVRVAIVEEDLSNAEALLNEARQALDAEPETIRAILSAPTDRAQRAFDRAKSGQDLYFGFAPDEIESGLRQALIEHLKQTDLSMYDSLGDSVIEAMQG